MSSEKNTVDFSYRSYNGDHDTDLSLNINGENVDNDKLKRLLNTWLIAIDSTLVVVDSADLA